MRAALALGSVSRVDRGYLGESVVLVNRPIDSDCATPRRRSGHDLAPAVPDGMYRDVILPDGRSLVAGFRPIDVAVAKKDFACGAWLHSPARTAMR
ncbi:hypothetical protein [Streptomyces bullii]|uniref:Uncharacterized protein n=1 Tax=Streptomyces bullii TaxID=349910 RepID=A0ABW0V3K9_9ACTN